MDAVEPEELLIIKALGIATVLQFQTYRKALLDASGFSISPESARNSN